MTFLPPPLIQPKHDADQRVAIQLARKLIPSEYLSPAKLVTEFQVISSNGRILNVAETRMIRVSNEVMIHYTT
jgi:hypothetical protein